MIKYANPFGLSRADGGDIGRTNVALRVEPGCGNTFRTIRLSVEEHFPSSRVSAASLPEIISGDGCRKDRQARRRVGGIRPGGRAVGKGGWQGARNPPVRRRSGQSAVAAERHRTRDTALVWKYLASPLVRRARQLPHFPVDLTCDSVPGRSTRTLHRKTSAVPFPARPEAVAARDLGRAEKHCAVRPLPILGQHPSAR